MFPEDTKRSKEIENLLSRSDLNNFEVGLAIIDLKESTPKIFGYNMGHFIYPASVYKVFIGAEVLRRIEIGDFSIENKIEIKSPNDVDKDPELFPGDKRGLLKEGDSVSIDYLLNLMLTRSDNTASNVLIDLVGRVSINNNIVEKYNWQGSGVTRKFLNRNKEEKKYRHSETTKTCARHMTEFMYLIETGKLVSLFVSDKLKYYMTNWNREGRQGLTISEYLFVYRKGGYLENNLYSTIYKNYYHKSGFGLDYYFKNIRSLLKNIIKKGWAFICWQNDVAVITGQNSNYVASIFVVTKSLNPSKRFPMEKFAKRLYKYMESKKD